MTIKELKQVHAALFTASIVAVVACSIGNLFTTALSLDLARQVSGHELRHESVEALIRLMQLSGFVSAVLGPAYAVFHFKLGMKSSVSKLTGGLSFLAGFSLFIIGFQQIRISGIKPNLIKWIDEVGQGGDVQKVALENITAVLAPISMSFAFVGCLVVFLLVMRFVAERWGQTVSTPAKS